MSVFDDAAKILGADAVTEILAEVDSWPPLTDTERAHLAPLLARYLPPQASPAPRASRAA